MKKDSVISTEHHEQTKITSCWRPPGCRWTTCWTTKDTDQDSLIDKIIWKLMGIQLVDTYSVPVKKYISGGL